MRLVLSQEGLLFFAFVLGLLVLGEVGLIQRPWPAEGVLKGDSPSFSQLGTEERVV